MGDLVVLRQDGTPRHEPFGRPTLYSEAVKEAICERIRKGIRPEAAAVAQGIDEATYYRWMQTREDFCESVSRADAEAESTYSEALLLHATTDQGKGDGKLCVEWLKRRRRASYGDVIDIRRIDTEQLRDLLLAATAGTSQPADETLPALVAGDDAI